MLSVVNNLNLGSNSGIGLGYNSFTNSIFTFAGGTEIYNFDLSGNLITSFTQPGESSDDFDLSIAPEFLTLGETLVPQGSLLAINGEPGTTDIYAFDPEDNTTIASLTTEFGSDHIVGGSYHPQRDTFFLVQDRLTESLIAEINPLTGAVLNTFSPGDEYSIFYGDLEVDPNTGNLLVVSSDETSIREFSPIGEIIQDIPLPSGVSSLSGIGLDSTTNDIWVGNTRGTVWQLANQDENQTLDSDGVSSTDNNDEPELVEPVENIDFGNIEADSTTNNDEGLSIQLQGFSPNFDSPVSEPLITEINDGVEYTELPSSFTSSSFLSRLIDMNIDLDFGTEAGTIFFEVDENESSGTFASAEENTYVFTDISDQIPSIENITIDESINTLGLEANDITFTENTIEVNVESLPYSPGLNALLNIEFAEM